MSRVAVILALISVTACSARTPCGPRPDGSVLACVADTPITATIVREHLGPPRPIPGRAAVPRPIDVAVEAAIRVQLFADEARRLRLAPDQPQRVAVLNRAFIARVIQDDHLAPDQVTDAAAAAAYADAPGRFTKVESVRARAIYVGDAATAEALALQARGLDDAGFADLARQRSNDPSAGAGGDLGVIDEHETPIELVRLATELRRTGDLAGPRQLGDGRFVVLRATEVIARADPLAAMMPRVKAALAHDAEDRALAARARALRQRIPVRIFTDAVEALATATPAAPAPPP